MREADLHELQEGERIYNLDNYRLYIVIAINGGLPRSVMSTTFVLRPAVRRASDRIQTCDREVTWEALNTHYCRIDSDGNLLKGPNQRAVKKTKWRNGMPVRATKAELAKQKRVTKVKEDAKSNERDGAYYHPFMKELECIVKDEVERQLAALGISDATSTLTTLKEKAEEIVSVLGGTPRPKK